MPVISHFGILGDDEQGRHGEETCYGCQVSPDDTNALPFHGIIVEIDPTLVHSDKKILIQNIIALPSHINAKAVSLMG